MTTTDPLIQRAEALYVGQLISVLEPRYLDYFVAIEPDSGRYFLGETMRAAIEAASKEFPERMTYVKRVGHATAIRIGAGS